MLAAAWGNQPLSQFSNTQSDYQRITSTFLVCHTHLYPSDVIVEDLPLSLGYPTLRADEGEGGREGEVEEGGRKEGQEGGKRYRENGVGEVGGGIGRRRGGAGRDRKGG